MRHRVLFCLLMLVIALPVAAQEGRGNLRMAVVGDISTFNFSPLYCGVSDCLSDLLFPHLLYAAPETQTFGAPPQDSFAAAASWETSDQGVTIHLRDDLVWSDGTPITAYDVFFSFLAYRYNSLLSQDMNRQIAAAAPLDTATIVFIYRDMTCDALNVLNFNILPAHAIFDNFQETAAAVFSEGLSAESWTAWNTVQRQQFDLYGLEDHPFFYEPVISAGTFRFHSRQYGAYVRLVSTDGLQGLELIGAADEDTRIDMFMRGEIDLVYAFDYTRVHDLQANTDVQLFSSPMNVWLGVSFNFADPRHPHPAFDDDGNPLEQGQHPIFNDWTVRRALQLATNIPVLMEASVEGNGALMPANLPQGTWAFDQTLQPVGYDPMAAARMLEEDGWRDINGDGVRECTACTTAQLFTQLRFELRIPYGFSYDVANILTQQWAEIGAAASVYEGDLSDQTHDAALVVDWLGNPANVDQYLRFTPAGDNRSGENTGSYNNPDVTTLLQQARQFPDCSAVDRADLYHQVQRILQEDQPYVWLFSVNSLTAARTSVANIAPYPNALFWNIRDWVIGG